MNTAVSKESLSAWWASLTPDKRKTLMGVACLAVMLLVLYLFISAGPEDGNQKPVEARADVNLLTGSDTRTLGLEAVGAELKDAQRRQRELQGQIDRLAQQASTKDEVKALSAQLNAISESLGTLKEEGNRRAIDIHGLQDKEGTTSAPGTPAARGIPSDPREATRNGLFEEADVAPPSTPSTSRAGRATEAPETIKVQVFGEADPRAANTPLQSREGVYIPAGSIISGVLLTGVDAPTGMQSKRDPIPALMRIKHDAILPNRFGTDVKECFVLFGATGDLSTERALLRAETLSCIRHDGGVIEVVLDAYALGDDGKAGIRGRLVSRNGSLVAKAAFASFAEALSQIFRPVAIQGFNTSPGQRTDFQAPETSEALEAAGYAGFGGAMRRLSEYFVDLADEIVPFVEVDAARQVEAVVLKGVTLQIRSANS
jgi:conjugal transfer pilus assembly protein TraB